MSWSQHSIDMTVTHVYHPVGDGNVGSKDLCGRATASQINSCRVANVGNSLSSTGDESGADVDPRRACDCAVEHLPISFRST